MAPRVRKLTEPLATITSLFIRFVAAVVVLGIIRVITTGSVSFGGFGDRTICAENSQIGIGFEVRSLPPDPTFATRHGAWIQPDIPLRACVSNPDLGQRLLSTLTTLPATLLFLGALVLLVRIVVVAGRQGPFVPRIAVLLRRLGWLIIAGTIVVAGVQMLAADLLLNTMLIHGLDWVGDTIGASVAALFPEWILIGGALLTFARIMRLGAAMDDEIKATV